ncbi:substrate-binding domain-containing protein [Mycolicibacterium lacusdiani]|uniref:substrate-binding domain-containing protein n=1 Tax=Mycolicibacterium lacusdiani TaxID=2895283 RepID=UPI001F2A6A19|nr:substrate-binding domain-containing protein [Mycolicibacterium lacusdiani]
MGRHSIPDPDESDQQPGADRPGDRADDFAESRYGADEFDSPEPDRPPYGDPDDEGPDYRDDGYWQSQRDAESDDSRFDDAATFDDTTTRFDAAGDESPTRAFASTSRPPSTGPAHGGDWDGGEWTGSHRAVTPKRRGVSVGVIVALVTVVVVVAGVIMWRFFGDALSNRSEVSAARCVEGEVAVAVIADASVAEQVQTVADQYNESAAPVGDKCVKVGVRPADSDQVVGGFTGEWPADLGERPALWIPASSMSEARLETAAGAATVSDSRSLVTSPVVLAVRPELKAALADRNWAALPGLQSNATALDGLDLSGWGALRLALPRSGDADATYLASEAVAVAAAPRGAPPTAGASAINTLLAGQPELADDKASTALDALLAGSDPAASAVHAVAVTEQQLFQRGASLSDAKDKLTGWLPSGPAAIADYPTVLMSGDWLSQEQVSAASEFARFLRKPEALAEFAKAGFRAEGSETPASDVVDFGELGAPVATGDNATRATLAEAVASPAQSPAVTIMLDQSMSADEGGRSRLDNVTAALEERVRALPPTAALGLWTFDGVAGRSEVPLGPLSDQVGGQPRSTVLADNLRGQSASNGGAVSFTTMRLVFNEAMANYREGQPNSILVITSGPHTDQSLDGAGLQDFVRGAFQQGRPVAVDVVDFGADPDRATWEAVSQITGGTYTNLNASTGPELASALTGALG